MNANKGRYTLDDCAIYIYAWTYNDRAWQKQADGRYSLIKP